MNDALETSAVRDGAQIVRIDDHGEWLTRFESALRSLPEAQRQRSALALLDAYRMPEVPVPGATAPTAVFREAVRAAKIGRDQDIPHLDRGLLSKYLADLSRLGLV